jgi:hypothetical protein
MKDMKDMKDDIAGIHQRLKTLELPKPNKISFPIQQKVKSNSE